MNETAKKQGTILITGADGTIGTLLRQSLAHSFHIIQLDKTWSASDAGFTVDMANKRALDEAFIKMSPVDYIIHLAANPNHDATWGSILRDNIITTKHIYESARKYGVKRLVFASSTHLFGAYEGYPQSPAPFNRPIAADDPPRPDSDYATSKGFGELLARQYYDLYGIETICIRIGAVSKDNKAVKPYEKLWLSHRDAVQVFEKALLSHIPFGQYFATSDNLDGVVDISGTERDLGFAPQDRY